MLTRCVCALDVCGTQARENEAMHGTPASIKQAMGLNRRHTIREGKLKKLSEVRKYDDQQRLNEDDGYVEDYIESRKQDERKHRRQGSMHSRAMLADASVAAAMEGGGHNLGAISEMEGAAPTVLALSAERLVFEAPPKEATTQYVTVTNPSDVAMLVSLVPDAFATDAASLDEARGAHALPIALSSPRGGATAAPTCFGVAQHTAWAMPRSSISVGFSFRADRAGSYLTSYLVYAGRSDPNASPTGGGGGGGGGGLGEAVGRICLVGHAVAPVASVEATHAAQLQENLGKQATYRAMEDLLLKHVVAAATAGADGGSSSGGGGGGGGGAGGGAAAAAAETSEAAVWARRAERFAAANGDLRLRFERDGYGALLALAARAGVVEDAWDGDVAALMEAIAAAGSSSGGSGSGGEGGGGEGGGEAVDAAALLAELEGTLSKLGTPKLDILPPGARVLTRQRVESCAAQLIDAIVDVAAKSHAPLPEWQIPSEATDDEPPAAAAGGIAYRGRVYTWSWELMGWAAKDSSGAVVLLERLMAPGDDSATPWPAPPKPVEEEPKEVVGKKGGKKGKPPPKPKPKGGAEASADNAQRTLYEQLPRVGAHDLRVPPPLLPQPPSQPQSQKPSNAPTPKPPRRGAGAGSAAATAAAPAPPPADDDDDDDDESAASRAPYALGATFRRVVARMADDVAALCAEAVP